MRKFTKRFYKKLLSLFLITLFCFTLPAPSQVFAATTRFVTASDVHIKTSQDESGEYAITPSMYSLQKTVKMMNNINPDFVMFTGDNIDRPEKEALVMFGKTINKINKPVYVILGNHDVGQVMDLDKREYYRLLNKFARNNKIKETPCVKRISTDLVFFFMDGVNQFIPGPKGYFKDQELIWLEKNLKKYERDKVVIVQHFPLVEPYEYKSHRIYNQEEYANILKRHSNVIAIISGHYHFEKVTKEGEITHISVPALSAEGTFNEIIIEHAFGKKPLIKVKTHSIY